MALFLSKRGSIAVVLWPTCRPHHTLAGRKALKIVKGLVPEALDGLIPRSFSNEEKSIQGDKGPC